MNNAQAQKNAIDQAALLTGLNIETASVEVRNALVMAVFLGAQLEATHSGFANPNYPLAVSMLAMQGEDVYARVASRAQ